MNNKEMIEYRIKEEGKEEFLTCDEANNLVFYFDFPASMISYFYKGKDGRIRSNVEGCKIRRLLRCRGRAV